jgi:hypothetical protein
MLLRASGNKNSRLLTASGDRTKKLIQVGTVVPSIVSPVLLNLDASNTSSYNGSGATWTNIGTGGATYNTTLSGSPTWNSGGYFTFNGTNQSGQLARPVSDSFTLSTWFRTTQSSGATTQWWLGMGLMDCEVAGTAFDYGLAIGAGSALFGIGNPDTTIVSPTTLNDGTWHNVTATRAQSGGAMVLYVDGLQASTGTGNNGGSQTSATYMAIARLQTGISFFAGDIAVCHAYNSVLSAAQVLQNYNALCGRFGLARK